MAPGADASAIKKAWRKRAREFHPDKTGNDPSLLIKFRAIQSAYETLSDPLKKESYLQERWLRQAQGQKDNERINDLAVWIKECLALEKNATLLDPYRLHRQGLHREIESLSKPELLATLQAHQQPDALLIGARFLLRAARPLPHPLFVSIAQRLAAIEPGDREWQQELQRACLLKNSEMNWERYRLLLLMLTTALLCLLIAC